MLRLQGGNTLIDGCKVKGDRRWRRMIKAASVITTYLAETENVIIWVATVRTGNCGNKQAWNRREVLKGEKRKRGIITGGKGNNTNKIESDVNKTL